MIFFNTLIKNEEILLDNVLPIWKNYDIDKFVFFNDNSTDKSIDVITSHIPHDKLKILNYQFDHFNESKSRQLMLDYSKENGAKYIASIDSDELLSSNLSKNLKNILNNFDNSNIYFYWFNVINNDLCQFRTDGYYENSYHLFLANVNNINNLNLKNSNYHSSWRIIPKNLPYCATKDFGVIHLQALNKKFYALKQLWYKHFEYKNYGYSSEIINQRYDNNVNDLNFKSEKCPSEICFNLKINPNIFDKIIEQKKYKQFIFENFNEKLITFGKEYLN